MDKFIVACCVFSFISGAYIVELVEKNRGCAVEVKRGQITTVTIGRKP